MAGISFLTYSCWKCAKNAHVYVTLKKITIRVQLIHDAQHTCNSAHTHTTICIFVCIKICICVHNSLCICVGIMYSRDIDVNASGRGSDTPHQSAEHNGLQFRPQCIDCIWPPTDLTGSALRSRVVLITQSLNQLLCVISTTLLHSCTVNTAQCAHTMCKPPCTEYTTICYYDA